MANWDEKKQLLVVGGSALGLCLLAGGGVYWAMGCVEEEQLAITSKQTEIQQAEAKIAKIKTAEDEVIILQENLSEYVTILPSGQEIEDFVKTAQEFQRQSGVVVNGFKAGDKGARGRKKKGKFSSVQIDFDLKGTVWQLLQFMNLLENHERFVRVTNFNLKSADGTNDIQRRNGNIVHTAKLSVETYQYNGNAGQLKMRIPNYDAKRDTLKDAIFKRQQKVRMEKFDFKGDAGRRDIFVDPRLRPGDAGDADLPLAEQEKILLHHITKVQELKELLERSRDDSVMVLEQYRLRKSLTESLAKVGPSILDVEERGLISFVSFRNRWRQEVRGVVDGVTRTLEGGDDSVDPKVEDPWMASAEMADLVTTIGNHLKQGDLPLAKGLYETARPRVSVPSDDARFPMRVKLEGLYKRTTVAMEFASLRLEIDGVLVNEGGISGVLLNGSVFEEGEHVDEDLFVKKVSEEQIWFVYQGFVLIKTW